MTPYYLVYGLLLVCCLTGAFLGWVRISTIVALAPMLVLISGRGLVGVDSAFYVQQFDAIRYAGLFAGGFEPGFALLVYLLTSLISDSLYILVLLGTVTAILMVVAAFLLERAPIIFLMLIMPYFMFDMTMNGLRYGMAFSLVALGFALRKRSEMLFLTCIGLAATIQVSSLALAAGAWALLEARFKTLVGVAIIGGMSYYFFGGYLSDKISVNADLAALGGYSGLVPLVIALLTLAAAATNRDYLAEMRLPLLALLTIQLVAFGMARYFYAGLRVQSLLIFMTYIVLTVSFARGNYKIETTRPAMVLMLLVAILSTGLRLKNFRDEAGFGLSPFAPYYFANELVA